jgi:hypothetical protein
MLPFQVDIRKVLPLCLFLVLSFFLDAHAQRGAVTLPRNLVQLTDRAATVVHGRVTYAHVEPHPQYHNLSSVVVTLSVEEILKGTAGAILTFRQFIWDPRDWADRAGYQEGEDLVLFLNRVTAAGFTSPVGLEQGRFRVLRSAHGEPVVVNGLNNTALFQGTQVLSAAPGLSPMARRTVARPAGQAGPIHLSVLREIVHTVGTVPGETQ